MLTSADRLRERISADGPIPFAVFMEEALYGVGGYYARPALPIGEHGDFVTGSSLSPLFGRATARLLRELEEVLGKPAAMLEAGFGAGVHLRAVRDALGEVGGGRLAAWDRVEREPPTGIERLESPDGAGIEGLVFSYELFDALPVHRLVRRGKELLELLVDVDGGGGFRWLEAPLSAAELADLPRRDLADGQVVDLAPGWRPLYRRLADSLERGLLVTCDYGFETERLYDPRVRMHGTLACYRSQRVHRDPFVDVGAQDLTAHVDFSLLREEGERAGLETFAFTRQAPWLAACGILEGMTDADASERFEALQLMQLDGMGEEIRVLVQGRGVAWREVWERLPALQYL